LKQNTWGLVFLPPHIQAIGGKWLFRVKENVVGSINKYKASLVAKVFHQVHGLIFMKPFL